MLDAYIPCVVASLGEANSYNEVALLNETGSLDETGSLNEAALLTMRQTHLMGHPKLMRSTHFLLLRKRWTKACFTKSFK